MEPLIGTIIMFAGNFAPRGWAFCHGQLLAIAQNTALFSILGTTYGGNGQTTFALPDLRGRVPMQQGQGPGLSPRSLGEQGGVETVTLLQTQMPAHNHVVNASGGDGSATSPQGNFNATTYDPNTLNPLNSYGNSSNTTMNTSTIGITGGSQPHSNIQPFTCINFIIALEGIFPSRN